jgi:hypothetical protein
MVGFESGALEMTGVVPIDTPTENLGYWEILHWVLDRKTEVSHYYIDIDIDMGHRFGVTPYRIYKLTFCFILVLLVVD